jgi:uncharacterized OB-fold protein
MAVDHLEKIQPQPTELTAPYWDACQSGELKLQFCSTCSQYQFYPRTICSHCGGSDVDWKKVSGRGLIKSFTVARRGISKAYEAPYIVALIELVEGPCMMSNVVGADPEIVKVGAPVTVTFQSWGVDLKLPVFELEQVDVSDLGN